MKIAMYMPGLRSGSMSWAIYQDFAAAMRSGGADFVLLTDAPEPTASRPQGPASCPEGTVYLPPAPLAAGLDRLARPLTRSATLLATAGRIRRWLRANPSLDVLYMEMTYPLGAAAWLAARLCGWRGSLIMTPMGEDFLVLEEAAYGHRRHPLPRWLIRRTMRSAAAIRCISPMVLEYAGDFGRPMQVIPLNVANSTGRAQPGTPAGRQKARESLRQRLGLERDGIVLSLGRLHPFKGLHVLVESMTHVADAELVIAGPPMTVAGYGDYGDYLQRRAGSCGVADRVHLLGTVPHDEIGALMAAADVVVVPSLLESMNRVCAEAAAVGTPFVVTSSTGVAELIDESGVGQVVAAGDPRATADAICAVLDDSWQPDAAATRRFVRQFDASRVAARLLELISSVGREP